MELTPQDPWSEFSRVHREIQETLDRFIDRLRRAEPDREISFLPSVDLIETAEDYRVFISIPGSIEEDIDLAVEGDLLIVRGEREPPYDRDQTPPRLSEWRYGYFERRIRLPMEVDPAAITATYQAGVLTILIPKPGGSGKKEG